MSHIDLTGKPRFQAVPSKSLDPGFPNDDSSLPPASSRHKDTTSIGDLAPVNKKKTKKTHKSRSRDVGARSMPEMSARSVTISPSARGLPDVTGHGSPKWGSPAALRPTFAAENDKLPPLAGNLRNSVDTTTTRPSARTPPPVAPSSLSGRHQLGGPTAAAMHEPPLIDPLTDDEGFVTATEGDGQPSRTGRQGRIRVVVRKRPLPELDAGEDCVDVQGPAVHVGATKQRVDLTEYVEQHHFAFDDAFDASAKNMVVYQSCAKSLMDVLFEGGSTSCFAYGQTGSGKTHTMIGTDSDPGIYILAANDIFSRVLPNHRVFVSLYEIYCNSLFDLLNSRAVVVTREDANKKINVCGLSWHEVTTVPELINVIERGTVQRRTGSTSANEFSSRSHAVMTITVRDELQPKFCGCLNIVDLAGSERAADTAANDKQTRLEGAEINKSLLALKECIRGLDERKKHIPFRGSKLTEVLRDSFVGNSRTVMVATVSPSSENSEHTLNTLRYAFRVKGLTVESSQPCKERNAPRPAQPAAQARSRSTEPSLALQNAEKKKKKAKSSAGRKRSVLSPRGSAQPVAEIEAEQKAMKMEMYELKKQMEMLVSTKEQDSSTIRELRAQNRDLMEKVEKMLESHKNAVAIDDDNEYDTEVEEAFAPPPRKDRKHKKRRKSVSREEHNSTQRPGNGDDFDEVLTLAELQDA